jgi:hypothetical protein
VDFGHSGLKMQSLLKMLHRVLKTILLDKNFA